MATLQWRRVGKLSGPGNVLNDRFKVYRVGPKKWQITDLDLGRDVPRAGGLPLSYPTMALARQRAERLTREDQ